MRLPVLVFLLAAFSSTVRAQSNDSFENRLTLSGTSPTAVSNNLHATRQTGEPNHAGASAGRSLWWTWTAPTTGTVNLGTYYTGTGAPLLRAMAVYTGGTLDSLTEVASSNNQAQAYYLQYVYPQPVTGTSLSVPVTAGTVYQIAIDALAPARAPDDGTVVLAINAVPTILSAANVTATTGTSFTYAITATGGPTSYAATNLPTGLISNTATGQITGAPAVAGTYNIGLAATGPGGTGTATLALLVRDPVPAAPIVPVITSAASTRGLVGTVFSFSIYASGSPTAYTATNLPPGLSFNTQTGVISGTPTTAGTTSVPITATGAGGTGTATLTLLIDAGPPPPAITSALAASGTTGSAFSYYIYTNVDSQTGAAPTACTATGLPPGLTLTTGSSNYLSGTPIQSGIYPVPISVTNAGGTRGAMVTITISDPVPAMPTAAAPVLSSVAAVTGVVGTAFNCQLSAANTPTAYTASNLPPGLTFDPQKGLLSGTPTAAGTFLVPVSASNSYGTSTGTLTVTVAATSAAQSAANGVAVPVILSPAAAAGYVGQTLTYSVSAAYQGTNYLSSSGGGSWIFSATGLPPGLSVTASTNPFYGLGTISGTPTTSGIYKATISATCPASTYSSFSSHPATTGTAVVTFTINAGPSPVLPVFTSAASVSATSGTSFAYSLAASGSPTSYAASSLPPGLTLNATSGLVSGTPTTTGAYAARVSATNTAGTSSATVTFNVVTPTVPLLNNSSTVAGTVGSTFTYSLSTNTGGTTTFSASNLPPGLSLLNAATGVISGTPTTAGVYTVPVSAASAGGNANATLTFTISPVVVRAPIISSSAAVQWVTGNSSYFYIQASSSPTSYGASNLPPGVTLDTSYGAISGTPTTPGTYLVPISATNSAGTGTATLTIIVANPGVPVFTGGCALYATVGQAFGTSIYTSNYPTSYTFSGLPAGMTQTSPGYISGTVATVGVYPITVTATNATGSTTATFTLTVSPAAPPAAPVIQSAAGAMGGVGNSFQYTVQASNTPTAYSIDTPPSGLTFNTATGILAGTPTTAGVYSFTVSATNAGGTGSGTINLNVLAAGSFPNTPVVTSPAGMVGYYKDPFYYAVTATNLPTGFSATNLPPGLSINAASGIISGSPTSYYGHYAPTVTVTNSSGSSTVTVSIELQTYPSPTHLTSPATVSLVVGQAFSKTLTTNDNSHFYTAGPLPAGLTLNATTGVISGTPTTVSTILSTVGVAAQYGSSSSQMVFAVRSAASTLPDITSAVGVGGYVGVPVAFLLTGSNSPTSFAASGLPAGLTLNTATGLISGLPTTVGTTTATVAVRNATGSTSAMMTFNIGTPLSNVVQVSSPALTLGYAGVPFNYTLALSPASYAWTRTCSNLPPGMTFNASSGLISGTPTTVGTYQTTVSIYNSNSVVITSAVINFVIATAPVTPPVFTSAAGSSVSVNSVCYYTLAASGNPTAYTVGTLPPGLSLVNGNIINGTTGSTSGTYIVPLTATNANGTASATLTLTVLPLAVGSPDLSNSPLEQTAVVGTSITTYLYGTPSITNYTASGLPPGLVLDPSSGSISGTPTAAGTYPVSIAATNVTGTTRAVVTYVVSPTAAVSPPAFTSLANTLNSYTGIPIPTVTLAATNSPTSYAASGLPAGLSLNPATGAVTGTPTAVGRYSVNLSAVNAAGTGTAVWTVLVNDPSNLQPVFSGLPAEIRETVGLSFSPTYYLTVVDNITSVSSPLTFTFNGLPPGVTAMAGTNSFSLAGNPTSAGTYPLTVTATVPGGGSATAVMQIAAFNPTAPGVASAVGALGNVYRTFSYTLSTSGTVTSSTCGPLPDGLSFNSTTSIISGSPTTAGTTDVPLTTTGPGGTTTAVLTIRIDPPLFGGLPVISSAAAVGSQDFPADSSFYSPINPAINYALTAINRPTSFSVGNLPAGLSFNPATALISGTPVATGVFQVSISATNAIGTTNATLTVISNSPRPALLTALASSSYVGGSFYTSPTTYFPSSSSYYFYPYSLYGYSTTYDPLVYGASGLPPGLTINNYNGLITGTATRAGTYPVTLSVANRAGATQVIQTFFVADTVPAASAVVVPSFNGNAEAVGFVGLPMTYNLSATGPASYSAVGLLAAFTLNPASGTISGTPTQAGTASVTVYATNSAGTRQATLTLTVEPAPTAPTIYSAAAATSTMGTPFSYFLAATNYSGMPSPTAYAAGTLPAGLTINPLNGLISGTPAGPAGTYTVPISAAVGPALTANVTLTLTVLPIPTVLPLPVLSSAVGSLGLIGNPFYYAVQNNAFAPMAPLPPGLAYDPVKGTIAGYPSVAGTYFIPLSAPDPNGSNTSGSAVRAQNRKVGVVTNQSVRRTNRRVLSTTLPADSGNSGPSATLTIQIIAPDFSLPRLTAQPSGGLVDENTACTFSAAAVGTPTPVYQWRQNGMLLYGVTGPTLALGPVQSGATGDYTVTATNAAGSVTSAVATLLVQTHYGIWQTDHFTSQEIASGLAADTYNFSGDGVANLLKYALGLDPRGNAVATLPNALRAADGALEIQFDRDAGKTDITYLVEVSTDLRTWTTIAQSVAGTQMTGLSGSSNVVETVLPGSTHRTVTVEAAAPTVGNSQFLHLRITRP